MRKSFILSIYLLSLSLIFNCGSVRKKAESEKAKKTGNIAGIAIDLSTMEPLGAVRVGIEGIPTTAARSDSLGRFWLSSVPVGNYVLWAQKITFHPTRISNVKVFNDSTSIVLCGLCSAAIPEHMWCWGDWDGRNIKTDSGSFFKEDYKNLLKNK